MTLQLKKPRQKGTRFQNHLLQPPPKRSMETLMQHKDDKSLWSEDWLVNYKPEIIDKTPNWRNCKLLGSKLDTLKDFQRRRALTIDIMREMDFVNRSKSMSIQMKIRTFNAFASSVFLYNSELWTLTATIEKQIDSFQRRMLRKQLISDAKKDLVSEPIPND